MTQYNSNGQETNILFQAQSNSTKYDHWICVSFKDDCEAHHHTYKNKINLKIKEYYVPPLAIQRKCIKDQETRTIE